MPSCDFDRLPARRDSDSNKWRKFPAAVLPLWVADMDFRSPPAVIAALHARVEHGFFGCLSEAPELRDVVAERLAKRYGWRVEPEAVVPVPGVNAGVNLAVRALTSPGDGLLVQTPLFYVLGVDVEKRAPRMFRMDRIRKPRLARDRTFVPDPEIVDALMDEGAYEAWAKRHGLSA